MLLPLLLLLLLSLLLVSQMRHLSLKVPPETGVGFEVVFCGRERMKQSELNMIPAYNLTGDDANSLNTS